MRISTEEEPIYAFIIESKAKGNCEILIIKNLHDVLEGDDPKFTTSRFSNDRLSVNRSMGVGDIGLMIMRRSGFVVDYDISSDIVNNLYEKFFEYYKENNEDVCNKLISRKRNNIIGKLI